MFKPFNVVVLSLVVFHFVWGAVGISLELREQCDAFCFDVLKPILNHIAANQQRWNACDSAKLIDSQALLDKLETQLKEQQERIAANELAINETKEKCNTLTLATKKDVIPDNFEKLGSKYYYIEKYHQLSWFGALHTCRQMGGHLASPQNQEELNTLRQVLPANRRYWLDINDLIHEGEYLSETTGKRAQFLEWSPGEPNNHNSKENCVELRNLKNDQSMNDCECSVPLHFICEAEVKL